MNLVITAGLFLSSKLMPLNKGPLRGVARWRVLMGVPNSQLTIIFSAKYQLTAIFLVNSQLNTNFG